MTSLLWRLLLLARCLLSAGSLMQHGMYDGCCVLIITSPLSVGSKTDRQSTWYLRHWALHREGAKFCAAARDRLSFVPEIAHGEAIAAVLCSPWRVIPHQGHFLCVCHALIYLTLFFVQEPWMPRSSESWQVGISPREGSRCRLWRFRILDRPSSLLVLFPWASVLPLHRDAVVAIAAPTLPSRTSIPS